MIHSDNDTVRSITEFYYLDQTQLSKRILDIVSQRYMMITNKILMSFGVKSYLYN